MKQKYTPKLNPRGDRPFLNPAVPHKRYGRQKGLSTYQMIKRNNPTAEPLPFGQEEELSYGLTRINHGRFRLEFHRLGCTSVSAVINTIRERKDRRVVSHFDLF
jgi:hypothetical protein